jgi:hypothetical protein
MDTTAVSPTSADGAPAPDVRAEQVFLADSRLALLLLNHARYALLNRLFGTSREQANLLTVVLALTIADGAYVTARHVARAPFRISGADAGIGGFMIREAALGVGGPPVRAVPLSGALVAVAVLGGVALPGLRRSVRGLRAAEHRVRLQRMRIYSAAAQARARAAAASAAASGS